MNFVAYSLSRINAFMPLPADKSQYKFGFSRRSCATLPSITLPVGYPKRASSVMSADISAQKSVECANTFNLGNFFNILSNLDAIKAIISIHRSQMNGYRHIALFAMVK